MKKIELTTMRNIDYRRANMTRKVVIAIDRCEGNDREAVETLFTIAYIVISRRLIEIIIQLAILCY